MQCSWVKRLFKDDFHNWKVIPLFLTNRHLGKNFKFHNNIFFHIFHIFIKMST